MEEILRTFKEEHVDYLGYTHATYSIVATNCFRWHGDDRVVDRLEREYMNQFLKMSNLFIRQKGRQQNPARRDALRTDAPTTTTMRRPLGITIPDEDGKERRRRQEERASKEEDPSDPRKKRPAGEKKKSKGPLVGTLTTASNMRISIPLTEKKKEKRQLMETLQWSTGERMAPPVPYLENDGPSGLELQWRAVKEAAKRKAEMEATRARGEGILS